MIRARSLISTSTSDGRDRGAVLVMMALSLTAMMVIAALVIDGGQAYAQRRQMQTAADDAALSGTNQLYRVKFGSPAPAPSTIWSKVQEIATRNGSTSVECQFVTWDGTKLGACSTSVTVDWLTANQASGVWVKATSTRDTTFGGIAGRSTQSAPATAAATIQPLVGTGAPFIMCGVTNFDGSGGYDLLNSARTAVDPAKADALNQRFNNKVPLQDSQLPTCGAGSAFKGKSDPGNRFITPGFYDGSNGNGFDGVIVDQVVSAKPCPGGTQVFDGCDIVIPIADSGTGNGCCAIRMHIVALSVWRVTGDGSGNPKYYGQWIGSKALVSSGQGGTGTVTEAHQPAVIKLIE